MNTDAIGETTVAIRNLLQQGLGNGYQVTLYQPWESFGEQQGVNLFLYKVEEDPHLKNMNWHGDRNNPTHIARPPLSLTLYYLLTPYAKKITAPESDIAQTNRILGKAMHILHENPVLNDIHNTYFNADDNNLFSEDLRNSFEKIKITLMPMNMEEISKLWSMGDKPYKLSVTYHVSIVQIAPTVPAKPVAAPVQDIGIQVFTLAPPSITELNPSGGPVGSEVHIIGSNLTRRGSITTVKVCETTVSNFVSAAENEIVFVIPKNLKKGPEQNITVFVDGRESSSAKYLVNPCIASVKPQRGAVDENQEQAVPVQINGFGLQGGVQLTIGGVIVDPAKITAVNDNMIQTFIPQTLKNGHHDIELEIDGKHVNTGSFEVIPLIDNIDPSQAQPGNLVTIKGQRLNGKAIRISIGPQIIISQENSNTAQVSFEIPKTLKPGNYKVKISVDGHESNSSAFEVTQQ